MKVLIIGGSTGIGASLVRMLAKSSWNILFTYCKNKQKASLLANETGCETTHYDFTSDDSILNLTELTKNNTFDAIVNNAAAPYERNSLLNSSISEMLNYIQQGLKGTLLLSQAFTLSVKRRKDKGIIVNVLSSVVFEYPPEKQAGYVLLKHGLLGLSKVQSVEFKKFNVRVNSVSPGMTQTDFNSNLPPRFIETIEQTLPMGRIATSDEVASVIKFLLSPDSSYINGVNIPITGGQIC